MDIKDNQLSQLLSNYEKKHKEYIYSLKFSDKARTRLILVDLDNMNIEILERINYIINDMSKNDMLKIHMSRTNNLTILYNLKEKIRIDQYKIGKLQRELIDLNGQNESLGLSLKSSEYYNIFYLICIIIICVLIFNVLSSSEPNSNYITILVLALIIIIYVIRNRIYQFMSDIKDMTINSGEYIFSFV
jgi:hypothetical protein